ncbi:unnamed protein product [Arctogadus glacialis]
MMSVLRAAPQLEAFYSIFTTEQQDHVKSVEYLRSNFRPLQSLDHRHIFKSAVKDAWLPDLTGGGGDGGSDPYGTEASKEMCLCTLDLRPSHAALKQAAPHTDLRSEEAFCLSEFHQLRGERDSRGLGGETGRRRDWEEGERRRDLEDERLEER